MKKVLTISCLFLFSSFKLNAAQINAPETIIQSLTADYEQNFIEDNPEDIPITLNQKLSKTLFVELSDIKPPQCEGKTCVLKVVSIDCQSIPYVVTNVDLCLVFPNEGSIEQKQLMYGKASKIYNVIKQTQEPLCNPIGIPFCATRVENVICKKEVQGLFSKKFSCSLTYREIK